MNLLRHPPVQTIVTMKNLPNGADLERSRFKIGPEAAVAVVDRG